MNIEIPTWLEDKFDEIHPGLTTSHQKASVMRDDLYRLYRDAKRPDQELADHIPQDTLVSFVTQEESKKIANRIADMAPAIDDQNWAAIRRGVSDAQDQDKWDNATELRFIARLNDDFGGAISKERVQKSRITAFFDRLL